MPKSLITKSPWRPPERKAVTICIGVLATDGIVIAADAEESDTYFTRSQQKILTWHTTQMGGTGLGPAPAACIIAGAGCGGFVDSFSHLLLKNVRGNMTLPQFEAYAAETLEGFYGNHVRPVLSVDRNFDFSVLIGAYFGYSTCLLTSYQSTLRHAMPNAAIGIGESFALRLMDEHGFYDVKHTEVAAASIIATTKDCIEGCGKYTDIVSIHASQIIDGGAGDSSRLQHPNPLWSRVSKQTIAGWERSFGTKWASRQRVLTKELIEEELQVEDGREMLNDIKQLDDHTSVDQP